MKKQFNIFLYVILGITILFSACKTPSLKLEEEDKIILPTDYDGLIRDTLTSARISWQEFFPDTILQNYISTALANNQSFQQILERVSQSSSILKQSKAALFPQVNMGINTGVRRFGEYTMDGVGNRETNVPSLAKDKHIPDPYRDFAIDINFSWEADIWGKLSNKKKSSFARWMSSLETVKLSQTILVSEVSNLYFQLIALDREMEVLQNAINNNEKFIDLTTTLKKEGDATQLSVDRFTSRKLLLQEKVYFIQQQTKRLELSFSVLLGTLPFKVERSPFEKIRNMRFPLSYGVPAQLLQIRPDVRASEYELYASKADVNAAKAAFYPSLVLGGKGGFNSFNISKLFVAPASLVYDLAAGIVAPIFNRKEIKALWEISKSNQRIALSRYHETALKAYSEVTGLMSDHEYINKRINVKKDELAINQRSIENANVLFRLYFIDYLDVLSAEEQYLTCELELVNLIQRQCMVQVDLYRAIGGGFSSVNN